MKWIHMLEEKTEVYNLSELSRRCGWNDGRIAQILSREQVPNAIDAVKLCWALGITVESLFGDDAADDLKKVPKAATANQAAEEALSTALKKTNVEPRESNKGQGTGRKSG